MDVIFEAGCSALQSEVASVSIPWELLEAIPRKLHRETSQNLEPDHCTHAHRCVMRREAIVTWLHLNMVIELDDYNYIWFHR